MMNGADWTCLGTAAMAIAYAATGKPLWRHLLALLKGAVIGAVLGVAVFGAIVYRPGHPLDQTERWLLMFGVAQGIAFGVPLGMLTAVGALRRRLRQFPFNPPAPPPE